LGHEKVRKEENGRRRNERIMQCLPDILWKTSAKSSGFAAKMRRSSQTGPRPTAYPGNSHYPVQRAQHPRRIAAKRFDVEQAIEVMPTQYRRCGLVPQK
jgi:hypothetical protein